MSTTSVVAKAEKAGINSEENPYDWPSFYECWWEHLAPRFRIEQRFGNFLIHRRSIGKGLVPLRELRIAGWNNPAVAQDFTEERLDEFMDFYRTARWDVFRMIGRASRLPVQAFDSLLKWGFEPHLLPSGPTYLIDLSEGWEGYLKRISKNTRSNVRRKMKAVESLSPELVYYAEDEIDLFFDRMIPYHQAYWTEKNGYSYLSDPREEAFFRAWAKSLSSQERLMLYDFHLEGVPTTMNLTILSGKTMQTPLTIMTGSHQKYYPGILTVLYENKMAIDLGIETINLGPGEECYKQEYSTRQEPYYSLLMANPRSPVGRLYAWQLTRAKGAVNSENFVNEEVAE